MRHGPQMKNLAVHTQSANSPAWLPLLAFVVALALILGAAAVAFAALSPSPEDLAQDSQPDATAARRCPECGWIESKRDIPAGADNRAIRLQIYTVRMVDGSSRDFTAGPGDRWRLGERMKFIESGGQSAK